jgi:uncharacterized HhH-GPD family protein
MAVATRRTRRTIAITGDPAADALLDADPFALLAGMLLDQQFPMERAFAGPQKIAERLGVDHLDPAFIAAQDPEAFAALCATPPAVHRYPGSMAARLQALAAVVVEQYDGDAAALWNGAPTGADLFARLRALPGFGDAKARIFTALLGKQRAVRPTGWEQAAGAYAEPGAYRSVADVVDADSLAKVRAFKQEQKRAAKAR